MENTNITNEQAPANPTPLPPPPPVREAPPTSVDPAFLTQFQTAFGIHPEEFKAVTSFYQEHQRQRQVEELKGYWGDEFDTNYQMVGEYIKTLPPQEQALYNTVNGAKYLSWLLKQQQPEQVPGATPTALDKPSATATQATGKFRFTQSELRLMPSKEYAKRNAEIVEAYKLGLVDLNS